MIEAKYQIEAAKAADAMRAALLAVENCGADIELTNIVVRLSNDRSKLCQLFGLPAEQAFQEATLVGPAVVQPRVTVYFKGGPWDGQSHDVERVVGPVFAVGHEIGNHYWLDTKSDPPMYHYETI